MRALPTSTSKGPPDRFATSRSARRFSISPPLSLIPAILSCAARAATQDGPRRRVGDRAQVGQQHGLLQLGAVVRRNPEQHGVGAQVERLARGPDGRRRGLPPRPDDHPPARGDRAARGADDLAPLVFLEQGRLAVGAEHDVTGERLVVPARDVLLEVRRGDAPLLEGRGDRRELTSQVHGLSLPSCAGRSEYISALRNTAARWSAVRAGKIDCAAPEESGRAAAASGMTPRRERQR
jgi:hypothetical protein